MRIASPRLLASPAISKYTFNIHLPSSVTTDRERRVTYARLPHYAGVRAKFLNLQGSGDVSGTTDHGIENKNVVWIVLPKSYRISKQALFVEIVRNGIWIRPDERRVFKVDEIQYHPEENHLRLEASTRDLIP